MPRTRKLKFTCPATAEDRTVKGSKLKLRIDPSAESFLLKSKAREKPVSLRLTPGPNHKEIAPIDLFGVVKDCVLTFEDVTVQAGRLADLEFLIREDLAVVELVVTGEHADLFEDIPDAGDD